MKKTLFAILLALLAFQPGWASEFHYIREKANPLNVIRSGFVEAGGLGQFDPSLYEEVEGYFPANATIIPEPSLLEKLDAIFDQLPAEVRAEFLMQKAAVKLGLEQGDLAAVKVLIERTPVPDELKAVKDQMLQLLNGGG